MSTITQPVPEDVSQQVTEFAQDSMKPANQLQAEFMTGANTMPGFLQPSKPAAVSIGIDNKALVDAINQRALRSYRASKSGLDTTVETMALQSRLNRLTSASELVNAEHRQNQQARMNKYLDRLNRRRARAAVVGNVLGIAGAAAGAYLGGPGGAMAGYHLGQGIGQTAGQNQG